MPRWIKVCALSEVSQGSLLQAELEDGTPVCVANVRGLVRAIGGECTHAGGPLGEGSLEGLCVVCPWHGATFDLETGEVRTPPAHEAVPAYETRVDHDEVWISVD